MWQTGKWSDCSAPCGFGKRTRNVFCAKSGGGQVESKLCRNTKLPANSQKCYGKQCGKYLLIIVRLIEKSPLVS